MNVEIIRVEQGPSGTFGVLKINGECVCLTLERPWEDNKPNVSCIPSGIYTCKRVNSPHHGTTYEVMHVPYRSSILFHIGNTIRDSQGCILTGMFFGYLMVKGTCTRGLYRSKSAFEKFMSIMAEIGCDEFTLTIQEAV